jgi:hypothetical protein
MGLGYFMVQDVGHISLLLLWCVIVHACVATRPRAYICVYRTAVTVCGSAAVCSSTPVCGSAAVRQCARQCVARCGCAAVCGSAAVNCVAVRAAVWGPGRQYRTTYHQSGRRRRGKKKKGLVVNGERRHVTLGGRRTCPSRPWGKNSATPSATLAQHYSLRYVYKYIIYYYKTCLCRHKYSSYIYFALRRDFYIGEQFDSGVLRLRVPC